MTDVAAAIGLGQFKRYPQMLQKRKKYIEMYNSGLDCNYFEYLEHYTDTYQSSGHLYLTRLTGQNSEFRNKFIAKMAENGIACNVHYKPLPMHTAYKKLGFKISDFPNAYNQFANEVTLPLNTKMTEEDIMYVANTVKKILKGK